MEDTQVLDAESKAAPLQAPDPINKDDQVLVTNAISSAPDQSIYKQSPVAEKDHASEISTNINRQDYNYNSMVDKSTEPKVTTQSTTRHNVTPATTWDPSLKMDDTYKMDDKADYSWNKYAQQWAQSKYDQEEAQVLADYTKSQQEIRDAGAVAMEQYFAAAYSQNQTADKMGWEDDSGQVTSEERKTAFLKMSTAANMYTKDELQRYGIDSQLSVARIYAEAEMNRYALELYQDAIDLAIREAENTGFYISAEASEIMKQESAANEILANKDKHTAAEIARAEQVRSAAYRFYDKLGFEKSWTDPATGETVEYPGVKWLSMREYETTIQHNKEMEALQQQANEIAKKAAEDANYWANENYKLALREANDTRNLTEVLNINNAWERFGGDESTGVGNFAKDEQGNYEGIANIKKYNGHTYADVGGERKEVKVGSKGYYEVIGDGSTESANKKAQAEKGVEALKDLGNKVKDTVSDIKDAATEWWNNILGK